MNEFIINLSKNGEPEELLLFIKNFQKWIKVSGLVTEVEKFNKCTCGEALRSLTTTLS